MAFHAVCLIQVAHFCAPLLIFVIVLALGVSENQCIQPGACQQATRLTDHPFAIALDKVFRLVGPAIPMVALTLQTFVLPFSVLVNDRLLKIKPDNLLKLDIFKSGQMAKLVGNIVPQSWNNYGLEWGVKAWTIILIIYIIRVCAYGFIMKTYHYYASDHVFLASSIIASFQVIMSINGHALALIHKNKKHVTPEGAGPDLERTTEKWRAIMMLIFCWFFLFLMYYETFITAKYFHTMTADGLGLAIGAAIFMPFALWWHRAVLHDDLVDDISNAAPYLPL
jgi:hypothetical protein